MAESPVDTVLPDSVRIAFQGRATLTMPEMSAATRMDAKTLRAHVRAGDLECCQKGLGKKRPRRVCTLAQVTRFYQRIAERGSACLLTDTPAHLSGSSISRSTVIDFPARPGSGKSGPSVKRTRSRRQSVGKPSSFLRKSGGPVASR